MWRSHPIFSLYLSLFVPLSFSVCLSAYLCLSFCLILSLSSELPLNKTTSLKSSLHLTVQWQDCHQSSAGDHDQTNTAPSVEATYCTVLVDTGQEKLLLEMLWSPGSRCHMPTADWGSKAKMQILGLLNHALSAWYSQECLTQSSYLLDSKYAPSSEVASGTNLGWKGYKSEPSIWARANLSSLVACLTCEVWAPRVRGKKEPSSVKGTVLCLSRALWFRSSQAWGFQLFLSSLSVLLKWCSCLLRPPLLHKAPGAAQRTLAVLWKPEAFITDATQSSICPKSKGELVNNNHSIWSTTSSPKLVFLLETKILLLYVYGCFAHIRICALHECLVFTEARRVHRVL